MKGLLLELENFHPRIPAVQVAEDVVAIPVYTNESTGRGGRDLAGRECGRKVVQGLAVVCVTGWLP
jgi:hypothetical protein